MINICNLYIPLADGQSIPAPVLEALSHQTVQVNIVPCCMPGIINSNTLHHPDRRLKLQCETQSRNKALEMIKTNEKDYGLMMDRDCILMYDKCIEVAIGTLMGHDRLGCAALPWKSDEKNHIKRTFMALRVSALKNFFFRFDERLHGCLCMVEDFKTLGWECTYVSSDRPLIKELK